MDRAEIGRFWRRSGRSARTAASIFVWPDLDQIAASALVYGQARRMKEPSFSDTVVYQSPLVRIGAFRCDRNYPGFRDTGPAKNDCFVFPRTAVLIEHERAPAFVANPNIVTFYNRSQRYLRHEISERGDRCDWFGVRRDLACDAVRVIDPAAQDAPFSWHRGR